MDLERIELSIKACKASVIPFNYRPIFAVYNHLLFVGSYTYIDYAYIDDALDTTELNSEGHYHRDFHLRDELQQCFAHHTLYISFRDA